VERSEYERLAAAEDGMWWFRGLHANLLAALAGGDAAPGRILDAGCGTGGLLARLAAAFPRSWIVGLDVDEGAASVARSKSGKPICRGSVDRLPFADGAFDAILSADVLCHRGVDAGRALQGFRRCLKPGGMLVLNLPAYAWLYSAHDVAVDNARRFGRGELAELLAAAGFERVRTRFWNSLLFPLMVVRRKLWRRGTAGASDVALRSPPVERALAAVMALESRLVAAGLFLPFGGSILASAVKP
jgi:SAM-dependent methyltransferase